MDLNQATVEGRKGAIIRDESGTMKPDWTIRFDKDEKLFYYFNPKGEKAHKIVFNDQHRSSFQWRIVP